jgi:hypothetical protein
MMRAGGVREDVRVQNGDLLIIPQNFVSKMERYVRWGALYSGFVFLGR